MENPEKQKIEKKVVITRKIQIIPNYGDDKEAFGKTYETLYRWRNIAFKSANLVSTHLFLQEQIKDMFYFTDEVKVKLADIKNDGDGILTTSKQNSTYQMLSKQFKGDIPTSILTCLNSVITSSFAKNRKYYFSGERSLMNYKKTLPIPFQAASLRDVIKIEGGKDYTFTLHNLNFKTNFGKDLSGNELIFDRAILGEYKLADSSIQFDKAGKKLFMLAVFTFEKQLMQFNKKISCDVRLDFETPMIASIKNKEYKIGGKEEFLGRRLAIQAGLKRAQIASRYNKGGKGVQKKIAAIDKFKESEISYVSSRIHSYSAKLIALCINNKCGVINLVNTNEPKSNNSQSDDKEKFLLRNWSYFGLIEKIKYKANKYNIEVIESVEELESA